MRSQRNLLFGLSDEQYRVQYIFECDADRVTNAVQGNIDALTLYGGKIGVEVQQQIEDLLRHRNLTLWEDLRTYLRRRREEIEELFRFLDDEFANASTRLSFWSYLKEIFR